jgi:hypothetical protein
MERRLVAPPAAPVRIVAAAWSPNMPAPMISAPTSAKYACAYWSSTPVVPSPDVSCSTRARNVRVAT